MFALLAVAVIVRARRHQGSGSWYLRLYAAVAVTMVIVGPALWALKVGGEGRILVLEAVEIAAFAVFWIVQTSEQWDEVPPSTQLP
jgi:hypothetical protein